MARQAMSIEYRGSEVTSLGQSHSSMAAATGVSQRRTMQSEQTETVLLRSAVLLCPALDNKVLARLPRRRRQRIPLLGLGLDLLLDPSGPFVVSHARLPVQHFPQVLQADRVRAHGLVRLVADRAQGLDAGGVDALDGAHELQLVLEGGDHGSLLVGGGGLREGGKAQEVVQLGGRDGLLLGRGRRGPAEGADGPGWLGEHVVGGGFGGEGG
ncbi:hypothetical protein TCAP_01573, partial [Tolypocladium capitatum]